MKQAVHFSALLKKEGENKMEEVIQERADKSVPNYLVYRWMSQYKTDEGKECFANSIVGFKDEKGELIGLRNKDSSLVDLAIRWYERFLDKESAQVVSEYFKAPKSRIESIEDKIDKFEQQYKQADEDLERFNKKRQEKRKTILKSIKEFSPEKVVGLEDSVDNRVALYKYAMWAKKQGKEELYLRIKDWFIGAVPIMKKLSLISRLHFGLETPILLPWAEEIENALASAETSTYALGLMCGSPGKRHPKDIVDQAIYLQKINQICSKTIDFLIKEEEEGKVYDKSTLRKYD